MKQHQVAQRVPKRSKRKRVGRGEGSTYGKTSGRGMYGQGARSGGGPRLGFEGGQTPLVMRSPVRRGFSNARFRVDYQVVNVSQFDVFPEGSVVTAIELKKRRLIDDGPYKILGDGDIDRALTIQAPKFSAVAKKKIEAAGGTVEEIAG